MKTLLPLALCALVASACDNVDVCTTSNCGAFAFAPAQIVVSATQGLASAPVAATLKSGGDSAIDYSIACTNGVTINPATGNVSSAAPVTLSVQAPVESVVGTINATCSATSKQNPAANAQLAVLVSTSANLSGGGAGGGSGGGSGGGVGVNGGSVDHLFFAVVGDSRPANIDETSSYPTAIIGQIYQDVQALSPRPQFVVGTGDYMYANTTAATARPQASLYMQARAAWTGTFFPAMGNHECDGYTADNCTLNQTQNFQAFMNVILGPNHQALPYYAVPISGTDGSWNAKLLVIACNAWDAAQKSWLNAQLAQHTTYTLLARHEPAEANTGPCVNEVEAIMSTATYDLSLVGHTHEFRGRAGSKEIVVGNGGAPLSFGNYGYVTIERLAGGWQVKNFDYSTGLPVNTYLIQ